MNVTEKHQRKRQEQAEIFLVPGKGYVCTQTSDIKENGNEDGVCQICQRQQEERNEKAGFQKRLPCTAQKQMVAELHQTEEQDAGRDRICEYQEIVCTCSKEKGARKKTHLWNVQERQIPDQAKNKTGQDEDIFGCKIHF